MDLELLPNQYTALSTEAQEVLFGGSIGGGKPFHLPQPLLTTKGWKTIGTVEVGDYVFDENGSPTMVVAKSNVHYERTFRMWFDKYTDVVVGENHEWCTLTQEERNKNHRSTPEYHEQRRHHRAKKKAEGKPEKVPISDRRRPDTVSRNQDREYVYEKQILPQRRRTLDIFETQYKPNGGGNHTINTAKPLKYPVADLLVPPYVLGAWLGDGTASSGGFTTLDIHVIEKIRENGFEVPSGKLEKSWYIKGLIGRLRAIGVLNNKHIPEIYKRASFEQRLELVRGIMDSGGHIQSNGKCEMSLSHEPLARDFKELLITMGIKVNMREREAKLYGVNKKNRFRMTFYSDLPIVTLPRHVEKWEHSKRDEGSTTQRRNVWYITNVEEIEPVPLQCIQVESVSHMYLVGEHLIPTHNSFLLRHAAIIYSLYIPGLTTVLFRRTYKDLMKNHVYSRFGFQELLQPFIEAKKAQFNLSDMRMDFFHDNGPDSHIFLGHLQHEKNVYDYQGAELQFILWDELTHFTKPMYTYLITRLRMGSLNIDYPSVRRNLPWVYDNYFPTIMAASNPGGLGGAWVKKRWIDPAPPYKVWTASESEGGMKRVYIPSRLQDNKFLMKEDPNYGKRVLASGASNTRKLLEGDWSILEGGAFADLWEDEIHIIPRIKIPDNATIYRGLDWGTWHPSVVLYALMTTGEDLETIEGESINLPKRSIVIVHEIYNWDGEDENSGSRLSATEVGKQIGEFESEVPWGLQVRPGPADVQIFQQRGGMHNTIDELIRDGYNEVMRSKSDKKNSYIWRYDKEVLFEKADQSTGSRVTGLSLVRDLLKGSLDYADGGDKKGLYFTENVRHCISTIPGLPRSETNTEDVETKNVPDHAYDVVRYLAMAQAGEFQELQIIGI